MDPRLVFGTPRAPSALGNETERVRYNVRERQGPMTMNEPNIHISTHRRTRYSAAVVPQLISSCVSECGGLIFHTFSHQLVSTLTLGIRSGSSLGICHVALILRHGVGANCARNRDFFSSARLHGIRRNSPYLIQRSSVSCLRLLTEIEFSSPLFRTLWWSRKPPPFIPHTRQKVKGL
jgi:hypothetical protein